MDIEMAY